MTLTTEQFEELCSSYALGALTPDDEALLFEALEGNDKDFEKIFSETVGVSFLLNQSVISSTPSPAVKKELIKKIHSLTNLNSFSSFTRIEKISLSLGFGNPRFAFLFSLFLVVIIVEIVGYAFVMYRDVSDRDNQTTETETKLIAYQQQIAELGTEIEWNNTILTLLQFPGTEVFILTGSETNPQGSGKIFINRTKNNIILQFANLPVAPSDKEYHLWIVTKDNVPMYAGACTSANETDGFSKVQNGNILNETSIEGFSITLEPKENITQPTGSVYLSGTQKTLQTN